MNCSYNVSFCFTFTYTVHYLTVKSFFLPPNLLHFTTGCKLSPNSNFTSAFTSRVDVLTLSYRTNFEIIADICFCFFFFLQYFMKKFTLVLKRCNSVFDVFNSSGLKNSLIAVALSSRGIPPTSSNFNEYLRDKNKM